MELESIYALMERFERSSISGLELEQNGTRLKLEKAVAVAAAAPVAAPAPAAAPVAGQPAQAEEGEYIKAPLVGTFYTASGPDAAPFVQVGDKVQKGQTVCILEAMKAMSEIPAPMDCVIEEVLLDNGSLAAFDAPLFRVRRL